MKVRTLVASGMTALVLVTTFGITSAQAAEYPKNIRTLQKWGLCNNGKVKMAVFWDVATNREGSKPGSKVYVGVRVREIRLTYTNKGNRIKGPDAPLKPIVFNVYWQSPYLPGYVKNRRDMYGSIGSRDELKNGTLKIKPPNDQTSDGEQLYNATRWLPEAYDISVQASWFRVAPSRKGGTVMVHEQCESWFGDDKREASVPNPAGPYAPPNKPPKR